MADDVAQSIWAELHGLKSRDDGKPGGKLAYYSGVGSLGGWLRAVVGQLAIDQHRRQTKLVQAEEDSDLDRMALDESDGNGDGAFQHATNPEDLLSINLASADVEKALGQTLAELSDEDRSILAKIFRTIGVSVDQLALDPKHLQELVKRFNARTHRNVPGERLLSELLRMRKLGWLSKSRLAVRTKRRSRPA